MRGISDLTIARKVVQSLTPNRLQATTYSLIITTRVLLCIIIIHISNRKIQIDTKVS